MTQQRRNVVISTLTDVAHVSAPFITTFVLVHLAAPALATVGGSSLSSRTMLFGREYYQTSFGEKYLVLGPLAIHSLSGMTKRFLSSHPPSSSPSSLTSSPSSPSSSLTSSPSLTSPSSSSTPSTPSLPPPRPLSSLLAITGYTTLLFFLPIHYTTHRLLPASPSPLISSVGPSELDYEFVKVGLGRWPWTSWALYCGLVGSVAFHMVSGWIVIWKRYKRKYRNKNEKKNRNENENEKNMRYVNDSEQTSSTRPLAVINDSPPPTNKHSPPFLVLAGALSVILPTLAGIYTISTEPLMVFSFMASRYEEVFKRSWVYIA